MDQPGWERIYWRVGLLGQLWEECEDFVHAGQAVRIFGVERDAR